MIEHFKRNTVGRDFAVGDIHGCFTKLEAKLASVGFDPEGDRLFSVGDLVDRGAESEKSLEWLERPWFHAVRGNHEQMAIDWADGCLDARDYRANGGAWNIANPPHLRRRYAEVFSGLALGIDIDFPAGLVGIVHADCPCKDWAAFRAAVANGSRIEVLGNICMWSRDRAEYSRHDRVPDLLALIVGHTPMERPTSLGNVLFIDTGAVFGRDLTVVDMTGMFGG